jgi:hypothetical protein
LLARDDTACAVIVKAKIDHHPLQFAADGIPAGVIRTPFSLKNAAMALLVWASGRRQIADARARRAPTRAAHRGRPRRRPKGALDAAAIQARMSTTPNRGRS